MTDHHRKITELKYAGVVCLVSSWIVIFYLQYQISVLKSRVYKAEQHEQHEQQVQEFTEHHEFIVRVSTENVDKIYVLSDDFLVTNSRRISRKRHDYLIDVTTNLSVSETLEALREYSVFELVEPNHVYEKNN